MFILVQTGSNRFKHFQTGSNLVQMVQKESNSYNIFKWLKPIQTISNLFKSVDNTKSWLRPSRIFCNRVAHTLVSSKRITYWAYRAWLVRWSNLWGCPALFSRLKLWSWRATLVRPAYIKATMMALKNEHLWISSAPLCSHFLWPLCERESFCSLVVSGAPDLRAGSSVIGR